MIDPNLQSVLNTIPQNDLMNRYRAEIERLIFAAEIACPKSSSPFCKGDYKHCAFADNNYKDGTVVTCQVHHFRCELDGGNTPRGE